MRTEADDRALLARVSRGDRAAFDELYRAHAGWLTARLERRCGDPDLVDLAVQDTFVAVWKSAKKFRSQGDVGAWLWGIAIRRLIDQMRKRRPTPVEANVLFDQVASAEDELFVGGLHGELGESLRSLDPDLARVLVATAVDGLTTREAGQLLGIPQGTVKTRLLRARREARDELARLEGDSR